MITNTINIFLCPVYADYIENSIIRLEYNSQTPSYDKIENLSSGEILCSAMTGVAYTATWATIESSRLRTYQVLASEGLHLTSDISYLNLFDFYVLKGFYKATRGLQLCLLIEVIEL